MSVRYNQYCESQINNPERIQQVFLRSDDILSVPPNVTFEVADLTQTWVFTHKFDFIFSRMMTGAFGDWKRVIQEYYK